MSSWMARQSKRQAYSKANSLQTNELTRGKNSIPTQVNYPLNYPSRMLVDYFSCILWSTRCIPLLPCTTLLPLTTPAEFVSKQMVPDGPYSNRGGTDPSWPLSHSLPVTGTKSWHKSLTPASSTHLRGSSQLQNVDVSAYFLQNHPSSFIF